MIRDNGWRGANEADSHEKCEECGETNRKRKVFHSKEGHKVFCKSCAKSLPDCWCGCGCGG